jgi:hypothetical protein
MSNRINHLINNEKKSLGVILTHISSKGMLQIDVMCNIYVSYATIMKHRYEISCLSGASTRYKGGN